MTAKLSDSTFNDDAFTYAKNLKHGLHIGFEHIMAFFMEMFVRGYKMKPDELDTETLLHMAHWAHELVSLNFDGLSDPYKAEGSYVSSYDKNFHHIPSIVVVLLMYKAKTTSDDNSFCRAFYRAFYHFISVGDNEKRNACVLDEIKRPRKDLPGISHMLLSSKDKKACAPSFDEDLHSGMSD